MRRPPTVVVLATLQFLAAGALCIVRLGDGTLDGDLSAGDVAVAIAIAVVGAAVVGATWSGHRAGWYGELLLTLASLVWGIIALVLDAEYTELALVGGAVWLLLLVLPPSRAFYLRPTTE